MALPLARTTWPIQDGTWVSFYLILVFREAHDHHPGYESTDVGANGTNIALGVLPPPVIAVNGTMWVGGGSGANTVRRQ
jgi:hypothetical protein